MQDLWCCVGFLYGEGETMLSQDLIVAPTQSRPPALIEGSGRKARDRIEHFLRAAHASTRTTQLYDRREDRVTLDEVVKINIRGRPLREVATPGTTQVAGDH